MKQRYVVAQNSYTTGDVMMHQVVAESKREALLKGLQWLGRKDVIDIMGARIEGQEPDYEWERNVVLSRENERWPDYQDLENNLKAIYADTKLSPPIYFAVISMEELEKNGEADS